MNFVDVGFSNFVEVPKILGVSRPDSSPIRRMIQAAKDDGRFFDYTQGKKTRCVIYSSCGDKPVLIASAIQTTTVIDRINRARRAKQIKESLSEGLIETTVG